jgi:hypothetical protein
MDTKDVILDGLDRIRNVLRRTLDGLTLEEVHRQPSADTNSIAWLAWHLTRVQDNGISGLAGWEQAWISQKWHAMFHMEPDPDNEGFGHTPAQVAAFRAPSVQSLLDYHESVIQQSKAYVNGLAPADFDRQLNEPEWQPPPNVGGRLVSVLSDNLQHAGQAAYLRGLFQGKGWLPY